MNQPIMSSLVFRQLFDKDTATYTYLLFDSKSMEGVMIDPVKEQYDRDFKLIEELGVELLYVLDTHVHADHVTSACMLREAIGVKSVFGIASGVQCADVLIKDGDELEFGQFKMTAISTPGHTDACTSYYIDGMLFTGDALLIRGCGRTDFQQGSAEELFNSITKKLYTYSNETKVYPGHDYSGCTSSSIAEEKSHNKRIGSSQTLAGFSEIMNSLQLPKPKRIDEAVPLNLSCGYSPELGHINEENFSMHDLNNMMDQLQSNEKIIDVRTPNEYMSGHVPGSLNIPMGSEQNFIDDIKAYDRVYIYCHSGRRAQTVHTMLSMQGLNNIVCAHSSGMIDWMLAGFPVEQ